MNKILVIALFVWLEGFGQNFSGTATYEYIVNPKNIEKAISNIPNLSEQSKKIFEDRMRSSLEKTFLLSFNRQNSVFKEQQKLDLNSDNNNGSWSPYGIDVAFYKDLKTKVFITQKDLMGKMFSVRDTLINPNWVIQSETKKIGIYNCQKSTSKIIIKPEDSDEDKNNVTNFFDNKQSQIEKTIVAWYAIDIPISNGPSFYWGLPGLILEIEENGDRLVCTKIVLNPKKKQKIIFPKRKELISETDYQKIVDKKNKELENIDFTK